MANPVGEEYPVIWLQTATCTGCSVSVLNSVSPTIKNLLIDQVVPGKHVSLQYHATIMAGAGDAAVEVMERAERENQVGYLLVVEGAIPNAHDGLYGSIGERSGTPASMLSRVESLGRNALAVIALGTCASFGGIPAAAPNPSRSVSVREAFRVRHITTPVINLPGCPPHPDWFVGTVAAVLMKGLPRPSEMDDLGRPRAFYGRPIHENCQRRAHFDEGKFARQPGDPGCLYELGCKGPVTYADCPNRLWNGGVNWCVGNGSPCMGCVEPGFPDPLSPVYVKLSDERMPKVG